MADIFISYSKADQAEARLLAAFLEAEGYDVWWDTSLLSGDKYRKVIMEELAKARAAIVIWTENSVKSDWVMSEAGRAHADQKLIPVKARGLEYKNIPPPLDNQYIENLDARENILAAVQWQLAKPQAQSAPMWKKARFELLSWFGIVGATITLVSNLSSLVEMARWVKLLVENWIVVISWLWNKILFFVIEVDPGDAIALTCLLFFLVTILSSSIPTPSYITLEHSKSNSRPAKLMHFLISISIISVILLSGLINNPLTQSIVGVYIRIFLDLFPTFIIVGSKALDDIVSLILSIAVPVFIFVFLVGPIFLFFALCMTIFRLIGFQPRLGAINTRLWRIIFGVALILALNYASLWIEQQTWAKSVLSG